MAGIELGMIINLITSKKWLDLDMLCIYERRLDGWDVGCARKRRLNDDFLDLVLINSN